MDPVEHRIASIIMEEAFRDELEKLGISLGAPGSGGVPIRSVLQRITNARGPGIFGKAVKQVAPTTVRAPKPVSAPSKGAAEIRKQTTQRIGELTGTGPVAAPAGAGPLPAGPAPVPGATAVNPTANPTTQKYIEQAMIRQRQAIGGGSGGKLVTAAVNLRGILKTAGKKTAAMYIGKPGTPAAHEDDIIPLDKGMTPEEVLIAKNRVIDKSLKRSGRVY